jgi:hypothetical protein
MVGINSHREISITHLLFVKGVPDLKELLRGKPWSRAESAHPAEYKQD